MIGKRLRAFASPDVVVTTEPMPIVRPAKCAQTVCAIAMSASFIALSAPLLLGRRPKLDVLFFVDAPPCWGKWNFLALDLIGVIVLRS